MTNQTNHLKCGCIPGKLLCAQAATLWMHANHVHNLKIQGAATQDEVDQARWAYDTHLDEAPMDKRASIYQEFVFTVENMNKNQAEDLLNLILDYLEKQNLEMGGGYRATSDADYPWFVGHIERVTNWLVRTWKKVGHG